MNLIKKFATSLFDRRQEGNKREGEVQKKQLNPFIHKEIFYLFERLMIPSSIHSGSTKKIVLIIEGRTVLSSPLTFNRQNTYLVYRSKKK